MFVLTQRLKALRRSPHPPQCAHWGTFPQGKANSYSLIPNSYSLIPNSYFLTPNSSLPHIATTSKIGYNSSIPAQQAG